MQRIEHGHTPLAHGGLPVLQALADELVDARLAPDAADLLRRAHGAARAGGLPPRCPYVQQLTQHSSAEATTG